MSTKLRLLLSVSIAFAWITLVSYNGILGVSVVGVLAVLIPAYLKIADRLAERQERLRLAFDADYQHHAWNVGDDRTAIFGRYQP